MINYNEMHFDMWALTTAHMSKYFLIIIYHYTALYQKLYIQSKECSWGWANLSPGTCRAHLKRLIKEKIFASCWLFTALFLWCTVIQISSSRPIDTVERKKEGCKWREDQKQDLRNYWKTLRRREGREIEKGSTRSHLMENSLWKRLWTGRKADAECKSY